MISKREDEVTTAGVALPPPPVEDTATRLAQVAKNENTWEGARAALLRAMRLTREWERDETMLAHNVER